MWSIENKIGRLVEVAVQSPFGMDDVEPFLARLKKTMSGIDGRAVGCCDLRNATVLAPDVANAIIAFLRNDNPRVERTAFIVNDSALLSMQMTRILREAGNPGRRSFQDPAQALSWLSEVLAPGELDTLRQTLRL